MVAGTTITLGGVQAGAAAFPSGRRLDLDGGHLQGCVAVSLRLTAGAAGGVGTAANALEIAVTTLSASAGSLGINLLNDAAVTVDAVTVVVQLVGLNGVAAPSATTARMPRSPI